LLRGAHVSWYGMSTDTSYRKNERLIIRLAVVFGVIVGVLALLLAAQLDNDPDPVSPAEVYAFIEEIAPQSELDPEFVYALVWAESSLDSRAKSSVARGMMQLTKAAWKQVSDESYRHAWDWRTNIRVGIDYLAHCREYLLRHGEFNYPLLAASYRYGPSRVKSRGFDIRELKKPKNDIYLSIFNGNIHPVAIPASAVTSIAPRAEFLD